MFPDTDNRLNNEKCQYIVSVTTVNTDTKS